MSKLKLFAMIGCAFALCLALAGCGGAASTDEAAAPDAPAATEETPEAAPEAAPEQATSEEPAAAEATYGNGKIDCEFMSLKVTGQSDYNYSDGTKGKTIDMHIVNKTDHDIHVVPSGDWTLNGKVGYGLIMEQPAPNSAVDTYAFFTDEEGSAVTKGAIKKAVGEICVEDADYNVVARYKFTYKK